MDLPAKATAGGIRLAVRLQPRASRNAILGLHGEGEGVRLKIQLSAPPVDNAANKACQEFLAGFFGVPKGAVRLVQGDKSRDKLWDVDGEAAAMLRRLAAHLAL